MPRRDCCERTLPREQRVGWLGVICAVRRKPRVHVAGLVMLRQNTTFRASQDGDARQSVDDLVVNFSDLRCVGIDGFVGGSLHPRLATIDPPNAPIRVHRYKTSGVLCCFLIKDFRQSKDLHYKSYCCNSWNFQGDGRSVTFVRKSTTRSSDRTVTVF